jgi:hypothetical protein
MQKGMLLAKGRTAEVFLWEEDRVLKLFYEWCSQDWIDREASMAAKVSQTSVPVPKCFGSIEVEHRKGIIYQRVQGPSLLNLMSMSPLRIGYYSRLMADLHRQIHQEMGTGFSPLKPWLKKGIQEVPGLPDDLKELCLKTLKDLPDGDRLCHFDFHPDQIIMNKSGPVVIDWLTAFQGDPLADVARTSILLTMSQIQHLPWQTQVLVGFARSKMNRGYIKYYLSQVEATAAITVSKWKIPIAAARLMENVKGEEDSILRFLRQAQRQLRSA